MSIIYNVTMKGRGPFILVTLLLIALVFVGGVRYGQQVEKVNKVIDYVVSLTPPSRPPTAVPTQLSVRYKTYTNKTCPVTFLYPEYLKLKKEASQSAQFNQDDTPQLAFSCERTKPQFKDFEDLVDASETAKLNPTTGRRIYFKLNPDLIPLIDSSIKYQIGTVK